MSTTDPHPFGLWLDGDRSEPAPILGMDPPRFWLSDDNGFVHLWCQDCTAGSDDYLGEWPIPTPDEYAADVARLVREHQAEKHTDQAESEV